MCVFIHTYILHIYYIYIWAAVFCYNSTTEWTKIGFKCKSRSSPVDIIYKGSKIKPIPCWKPPGTGEWKKKNIWYIYIHCVPNHDVLIRLFLTSSKYLHILTLQSFMCILWEEPLCLKVVISCSIYRAQCVFFNIPLTLPKLTRSWTYEGMNVTWARQVLLELCE